VPEPAGVSLPLRVRLAASSAWLLSRVSAARRGKYLERQHARYVERLQDALRQKPTSIVTACSFLPIVPTDLICYVCGVMAPAASAAAFRTRG
jgi:uncharacterized membrane protein YdjX (TVP38/TMEM64 family)